MSAFSNIQRVSSPLRSTVNQIMKPLSVRGYSQEVKPFIPKDKEVTHTGVDWAADDHRQARFDSLGRHKLVNKKFAIDLIKEEPPIGVAGRMAICDGGTIEALGHPRIYINLDQTGNHSCSYCGLRYFKKPAAH